KVLSSSDTAGLQRFFDLGQCRHRIRAQQSRRDDCPRHGAVPEDGRRALNASSTPASVGIASEHSSRDATIAPATLQYSTMRVGSQPDKRPCTSIPPNASPAPKPQTTSTK